MSFQEEEKNCVISGSWLRPIVWLTSTVEQRLRYDIPLKLFRASRGTILEVGSGSHGITRFLSRPVTGADVAFGRIRLGWLKQVRATACNLPFAENEFEEVLSIDMLEHLAAGDREKALEEIVRVASRRIVLGVPCSDAVSVEHRLANRLKGRLRPAWLTEHLQYGLPEADSVERMLRTAVDRKGVPYTLEVRGNVNVAVWYWLALTSHLKILKHLVHMPLLLLTPLLGRWMHSAPCYRKIFIVTYLEDRSE